MRIHGTSDEVLPLTVKQKYACNIVMGAMLLAAGVILVLAGTDVIHASVGMIAAPTLLFAFGAALLFSALVSKNAISMWLTGVILTCGLVSLLDVTTSADYARLYPMYIAAPGIGCLFAIWFSEAKAAQIKAMVFFGGVAGVFSLQSTGTCAWGLTGGILAAFVGACVVAYAINVHVRRKKDDA